LSRAASYAVRAAIVAAPAALFACSESSNQSDSGATNSAGGNASNAATTGNTSETASTSNATNGAVTSNTSAGGTGVIDVNEGGADSGGEAGYLGVPIYGGPFPDMAEAKV
jgi:hypothetical protein